MRREGVPAAKAWVLDGLYFAPDRSVALARQAVLVLAALAGSALLVVGCCSVNSIRTEALPDGTVGEPYRFALEDNCSGSSTTDVTAWTLSGQLPPGLRFSDDGRFSGTPTAAGSYSLTIQLMSSSGYVATTVREAKTLVLVIRPAAG